MTSDKIIGIDLGTTHSAVAIMEGGDSQIIENERGNRVTPSVVARKNNSNNDDDEEHPDEWLVGEPAASQESNNPEGTKRSFKRDMGEDITYSLHGEEYRPEELAAKVLRSLKQDAERFLGFTDDEEVKKAVITVPAYFSSKQRQATKDAAEIAGLTPLEVFDEPISAALAYARREAKIKEEEDNTTEKKTLLVFDLGGGTFDVTVMEYGGAVNNVYSTAGNNDLGGDDWDTALTEHLASIIEEETGIYPLDNEDIGLSPQTRLKTKAREAKEELSEVKEYTISLPFLFPTDDGMYNFEYSLTRAEFEDVTEHLVEQVKQPVFDAIDQAADEREPGKPDEFSQTDLDEVVLVGGATRMPQIQETVSELLDQPAKSSINPDEVVAQGAGYKAGTHSGEVTGVTLLDVLPLSIGLKVRNGLFERVIPKNKTRPIEVSREFTTARSNQTSVNIEVYQGERELASENEKLGDFVLTGIPPAPAGTPQIDVTFSIDDDGILSVNAEENVTGVNKEVTIEGRENTLSQEEINRLKVEAEEHAENDAEQRRRINLRNDAEKSLQRAYTILDKQNDAISPDLKNDIHEAIDEVEKYLEFIRNEGDVDYSDLRTVTSTLNSQVEQVGRDVYQPDDAHQDETIDVEKPEQDSKSAVPREIDSSNNDDESA